MKDRVVPNRSYSIVGSRSDIFNKQEESYNQEKDLLDKIRQMDKSIRIMCQKHGDLFDGKLSREDVFGIIVLSSQTYRLFSRVMESFSKTYNILPGSIEFAFLCNHIVITDLHTIEEYMLISGSDFAKDVTTMKLEEATQCNFLTPNRNQRGRYDNSVNQLFIELLKQQIPHLKEILKL
jgi:hypothetical protein